jgi:hypothetical protein
MEPLHSNGPATNAVHRYEGDSPQGLETGLAGLEQTASEILRVLEGGRSIQSTDHGLHLKQTQDEMLRTQVRENNL